MPIDLEELRKDCAQLAPSALVSKYGLGRYRLRSPDKNHGNIESYESFGRMRTRPGFRWFVDVIAEIAPAFRFLAMKAALEVPGYQSEIREIVEEARNPGDDDETP